MASFINILTKRVVLKKDYYKCKELLNNLYKEAGMCDGFLGASTYVQDTSDSSSHDYIWTMSKWTGKKEWEKWKKSQARMSNTSKSTDYVQNESHRVLNRLKHDVFLL